jgi:hypothetical protein
MLKIALCITIILTGFKASAGDRAFHCTINNIYKLNLNGEMEKESGVSVPKANDTFIVDRQSGVVIGERVPVFRADKFTLLAAGTDGNAFVTSYSARTQIGFLKIENYRNVARSPFVLNDGIWVATGVCI